MAVFGTTNGMEVRSTHFGNLMERKHGFNPLISKGFFKAAKLQQISLKDLDSVFCSIFYNFPPSPLNAGSFNLVEGAKQKKIVNIPEAKGAVNKVDGEWGTSVFSGFHSYMGIGLKNMETGQIFDFGFSTLRPFLRLYRAMLLLESLPGEIYIKDLSHCWSAGGIQLNTDEKISAAYIERRIGKALRQNILEKVPANLVTPLILMRDSKIYPDIAELLEALSSIKRPQGREELLLLAEIAAIKQLKINLRSIANA